MSGPPGWEAPLQELREQVNFQQRRIDELSEQLLALKSGKEEPAGVSLAVTGPDANGPPNEKSMKEEEVETAYYNFDMTIWDASLLLFLGEPTFVDAVVLFASMLINLGLQFLLLWVVFRNMLDNPYDDGKIESMVNWRIKHGQADFEAGSGLKTTLAWRICKIEEWSYEQSQYEEMHDYLYKPVPGIWLSILAIILWILTCLREYRVCLEQLLAVLHLPSHRERRHTRVRESDNNIQVVGIGRVQKVLAVVFLCLLRFAVIGVLSIVGCAFLAQTASLTDIVLNAVALAFVLDVDEGLCLVALTQRLRSRLQRMAPLSCGPATRCSIGGISFKDLLRYILFVGLLATTVFVWLLPFNRNVEAAALALCGGDTNFTVAGGTFQQQVIYIKPLVEERYNIGCMEDADLTAQYVSTHYPGVQLNTSRSRTGVNESRAETESRLATLRKTSVLNYIYRGCASGQARSPPIKDSPDGWSCQNVPDSLTTATGTSVGGLPSLPKCGVLNVTSRSCHTRDYPVCLWPKEAEVCEPSGNANGEFILPPGTFWEEACANASGLSRQCNQWWYFGSEHPEKNCGFVAVCSTEEVDISTESSDCFSQRIDFGVTLDDSTAWNSNLGQSLQIVIDAVKAVVTGLEDAEMYVSQRVATGELILRVRRWPLALKDSPWRTDAQAILAKTNQLFQSASGVAGVLQDMWYENHLYSTWQDLESAQPACTSTVEKSPGWCSR